MWLVTCIRWHTNAKYIHLNYIVSPYSLPATTGSPLISIACLSFLHVLSSSLAIQCLRTDVRRLLKLTEPVYFNHYLIQQEYCLLFHRLYSGGLHQGIKNNFNYIHTQIMIFIIDLTIKAEEKTLRLWPRSLQNHVLYFPGDSPLCFYFSALTRHQFRLRSAAA